MNKYWQGIWKEYFYQKENCLLDPVLSDDPLIAANYALNQVKLQILADRLQQEELK
jgi:hypothetical protein